MTDGTIKRIVTPGAKDPSDAVIEVGGEELRKELEIRLQSIEPTDKPTQHGQQDPFVAAFENRSVGRFRGLEGIPPGFEYLIPGIVPAKGTGVLSGAQDLGKTWLSFQMCACIATGTGWFHRQAMPPMPVMFITAEDDEDDLDRRIHEIAKWIVGRNPGREKEVVELLKKNLSVVNLAGIDARLTMRDETRQWMPAVRFANLLNILRDTRPRLLILDPISMFRSGSVNDDEEAPLLVRMTRQMQQEIDGFVLWSGHVTKSAANAGRDTSYALSGASGLENGLRWSATLRGPGENEIKDYGWDETEASRWVRWYVPKMKAEKPMPMWLRRDGGLLLEQPMPKTVPKKTGNQRVTAHGEDPDAAARRVLLLLLEKIEVTGGQPQTWYEKYMAEHWKIGQKALREKVIGPAIDEGLIEYEPKKPLKLTDLGREELANLRAKGADGTEGPK